MRLSGRRLAGVAIVAAVIAALAIMEALTGLPTTYILDSQGRIRASLPGPQTVASVEHAVTASGAASGRAS